MLINVAMEWDIFYQKRQKLRGQVQNLQIRFDINCPAFIKDFLTSAKSETLINSLAAALVKQNAKSKKLAN